MLKMFKTPVTQTIRPRSDLIAINKIDNHKKIAKVSERFYWSRQKVSDQSRSQISHELSFEHAQKTGRN